MHYYFRCPCSLFDIFFYCIYDFMFFVFLFIHLYFYFVYTLLPEAFFSYCVITCFWNVSFHVLSLIFWRTAYYWLFALHYFWYQTQNTWQQYSRKSVVRHNTYRQGRSNHFHVDVQWYWLDEKRKFRLKENVKTQLTWGWNNSRNLDIQYSKVLLHGLVESWGRRTSRRPYTSMRILRTQNFCIEQFTLQISSVSTKESQDGVKMFVWRLMKSLRKL